MTDKEIEEEIFKALVSGDAKLVPASELGYDEEYITKVSHPLKH